MSACVKGGERRGLTAVEGSIDEDGECAFSASGLCGGAPNFRVAGVHFGARVLGRGPAQAHGVPRLKSGVRIPIVRASI